MLLALLHSHTSADIVVLTRSSCSSRRCSLAISLYGAGLGLRSILGLSDFIGWFAFAVAYPAAQMAERPVLVLLLPKALLFALLIASALASLFTFLFAVVFALLALPLLVLLCALNASLLLLLLLLLMMLLMVLAALLTLLKLVLLLLLLFRLRTLPPPRDFGGLMLSRIVSILSLTGLIEQHMTSMMHIIGDP